MDGFWGFALKVFVEWFSRFWRVNSTSLCFCVFWGAAPDPHIQKAPRGKLRCDEIALVVPQTFLRLNVYFHGAHSRCALAGQKKFIKVSMDIYPNNSIANRPSPKPHNCIVHNPELLQNLDYPSKISFVPTLHINYSISEECQAFRDLKTFQVDTPR